MSGVQLDGAVAVVTGASSGIGRATAIALAGRGASVALAARSLDDLEEVRAECETYGATALVVETDVSVPEQVDALARRTIDHFGRFDLWINDAAVMAYGSFWDIPFEAYRAVVETNLFGTIAGSRVALEHFRECGSGVLVNVDSLYGRLATPYVSPYVLSKYAIRGFTRCLRQEVAGLDDVDVCAVLPQAVDTPIFSHAANYSGRSLTALPLTIDPDRVVRAVLRCAERPKREVIVGIFGYPLALASALLPGLYERLAPIVMDRFAFRAGSAPRSDGNVFRPQPGLNTIDGGWREQRRRARLAAAALTVAAAVAPVAVWRRRTRL